MTRIVDGELIIEEEPPSVCELCGATAELRPYGPNGENICFPCGMKDPASTKMHFEKRLRDGGVF